MSLKIEVTVKCINNYDNTRIYSCDATYWTEGNTIVHSEIDDSEVDDHTKALASDALYMAHTLLRSQIKNNEFTEDAILKRVKE